MKKFNDIISIAGKTAIVTGGAMGIGYGIAYRLAEAGADVVIADYNEEAAKEATQKLRDLGFSSAYIKTDVSKEADIQNMVDYAVATYGGLDILVNNAGVYPFVSILQATEKDFEKIIHTNLLSVVFATKAASDVFIKQGKPGKIINITSIDALHPSSIGLALYDASKHGLWGLTKNSALELAAYNIQVNAIAPGGIATPGVGAGKPATPEMEEITKKFLQKIPMKRMGESDEIGKVALFLASDMSSYMTGAQIVVDGGALLS